MTALIVLVRPGLHTEDTSQKVAVMYDDYKAWRSQWNGDYNGEDCQKCGRERVLLCSNGKRRCEKCNWCPETQQYELPPW